MRAGCEFSLPVASVAWCSLDFPCCWLRPILPVCSSPSPQFGTASTGFCARREGVNHANLRLLRRALFSPSVITPPKMPLINARSVANKTFLLNDFFSFHKLDFMFITESWTPVGDLSPFSDLVPNDCSFFNSPRQNGCGLG